MNNFEREDIKETIIKIVAEVLDIEPDDISEDLELDNDLQIDSLALYEIVVDIEEYYELQITNDEADDLSTVGEAIDFIYDRVLKS